MPTARAKRARNGSAYVAIVREERLRNGNVYRASAASAKRWCPLSERIVVERRDENVAQILSAARFTLHAVRAKRAPRL